MNSTESQYLHDALSFGNTLKRWNLASVGSSATMHRSSSVLPSSLLGPQPLTSISSRGKRLHVLDERWLTLEREGGNGNKTKVKLICIQMFALNMNRA